MGKNKKVNSLKLPSEILRLIDYYRNDQQSEDDYIFPELKLANSNDSSDIHRKIKTAVRKFNYYLKAICKLADIKKKVTNHIARHSFGNIAGDKISPQMLQKLYNHFHLSTTVRYQGNFIHKNADEALEAVIKF